MVRWAKLDPDSIYFVDLFKASLMCFDVLLNEDDNFTINGLNIIHDMRGFSLEYLTHLTPTLCKKLIFCLQSAYPLRIKGIVFINTPVVYEVFINLFTPFMNEKLTKRLTILREDAIEKLYEQIPQEVLPEEYGGKAGPISKICGEFRATVDKYKNWFTDDEQYGSDESKRPDKPKVSADIFGMEECGERLNID
ncbi:hypothetical protein ILUMI_26656 [Ignelater luminosus]|uniref:CRAL-TRIO domain-containing protein n=1 Tax=Ignelater luminosus TaxID=2038154 RepID=A0A8K0C5H8_IGNLU|nr:hypothetical protein ILUMI_26656 [Ignelater luminosus]